MALNASKPVGKTRDKGSWVTFRPDIRILDCTIRDGGLMNDHRFEESLVRAVYQACIAAGVDYIELGYKGAKRIYSSDQYGAWKHCDEDALRRVVGDDCGKIKTAVMADAERCDYHTDILPKDQSVLDVIRVACYIHQIPIALDMLKDAHDKGYETTLNLMAVSTAHADDLEEALAIIAKSEAETVYLVDSYGSLYSEEIRALCDKYLEYLVVEGKELGFHAHNNSQLAYANTVEAIVCGANRLDATICGLGRGAGNCPMELLIAFLHNPAYKLRPILQCIRDHVEPLRSKMRWGYDTAYMLTGHLNQHPRAAISFYDEGKTDVVALWDELIE